ncbi:MAG: hypothetical protein JWQ16_442 [Novosphingobium sp.]|nr:hypothetical protein [Novosphingobium sp.]
MSQSQECKRKFEIPADLPPCDAPGDWQNYPPYSSRLKVGVEYMVEQKDEPRLKCDGDTSY